MIPNQCRNFEAQPRNVAKTGWHANTVPLEHSKAPAYACLFLSDRASFRCGLICGKPKICCRPQSISLRAWFWPCVYSLQDHSGIVFRWKVQKTMICCRLEEKRWSCCEVQSENRTGQGCSPASQSTPTQLAKLFGTSNHYMTAADLQRLQDLSGAPPLRMGQMEQRWQEVSSAVIAQDNTLAQMDKEID